MIYEIKVKDKEKAELLEDFLKDNEIEFEKYSDQ